jgi:hypothetical protein
MHTCLFTYRVLCWRRRLGGGFDVGDENVSWKQDKKSSLLAFPVLSTSEDRMLLTFAGAAG